MIKSWLHSDYSSKIRRNEKDIQMKIIINWLTERVTTSRRLIQKCYIRDRFNQVIFTIIRRTKNKEELLLKKCSAEWLTSTASESKGLCI